MAQIEKLESKLEQVETAAVNDDSEVITDTTFDINEDTDFPIETQEDQDAPEYDVVLHVKPEKLHTVKTEVINGQRCIIIPIDDDEQATINGLEDLL